MDKDRDSSILLGNFNTSIEAAKIGWMDGWMDGGVVFYICIFVGKFYVNIIWVRVKYMDIWMVRVRKNRDDHFLNLL